MDLLQVSQLGKGVLVAQRNVDETVVSEGAHGGDGSRLLATTESTGGDEETSVLAPVTTGGPDGASSIPEGLPLSREVTVASRDTEQNSIVLQKVVGLADGVARLGRGVHLGQDLLGESLADPRKRLAGERRELCSSDYHILVDVGLATGGLNTLLFSLGQLLDVTIEGVLFGSGVSHFSLERATETFEGRTKTIAILGAIVKDDL